MCGYVDYVLHNKWFTHCTYKKNMMHGISFDYVDTYTCKETKIRGWVAIEKAHGWILQTSNMQLKLHKQRHITVSWPGRHHIMHVMCGIVQLGICFEQFKASCIYLQLALSWCGQSATILPLGACVLPSLTESRHDQALRWSRRAVGLIQTTLSYALARVERS